MIGLLENVKKFFYIDKWKKNKKKKISRKQLFSFFQIFSKLEKIIFSLFLLLLISASIGWWKLSFLQNTEIIPADGGILKETIIGQPQSLNPLFSPLNDADRDISELIFSGLLKYNKNGELVEDLAKEYKLYEDGKIYEFSLKDNLLWSDNKEITSNDIIFTIETIQDPEIQSPYRLTWQDIKMEKVDEKTVKFILPNTYPSFLENFTLKILPAHIFEEIEPQEFSSKPQKKIICSGLFKIKSIERKNEENITKVILEKNPNFYAKTPFLDEIELTFVKNGADLLKSKGGATNLPDISPVNKDYLEDDFKIYSLSLPRYFALFLNQENKILSQKEIREALSLAITKEEIINEVLSGEGRIVDGPLLPENKIEGDCIKYEFNIENAKKKLDEAGWKDENNDGIREKILEEGQEATPLELNLFTVDQTILNKTAEIVQKQWEEIGVKLNIQAIEGEKLRQDHIAERKYDILLLAHGLHMIPDPFSFWHSTQKESPGLNLSLYQNNEIDELLQSSRQELNDEERKKQLQSFQQKLTNDIPAIFLYSPHYLYAIKKEIKGIDGKYIIDPSKRFIGIEKWYINEKRVKK